MGLDRNLKGHEQLRRPKGKYGENLKSKELMIKSKQIFKKLGVFDGSFLINVVEGAKAFLISLR